MSHRKRAQNPTQKRLRELLDYDPATGVLTWRIARGKWGHKPVGAVAGGKSRDGYVYLWVDGERYSAHRVIWIHANGDVPADCIDHINGRSDDNRLANLRLATRQQNAQNKGGAQVNSKTGAKGVSIHACGKFVAFASLKHKTVYLGLFDNIIDAVAERMRAQRTLYTHHRGA